MAASHRIKVNKKNKLEDEVTRLCAHKGVRGVFVTTNKWVLIKSTFDERVTDFYMKKIKALEDISTGFVRDADPKNSLQFLRIESKKFEIMMAIAADHRLLMIHNLSKADQQLVKQFQSATLDILEHLPSSL